MRKFLPAAVLAALLPLDSQALSLNPRAMARFDVGYARCEALFGEMRGGRDEAYLAMWRVTADEKRRAELAAARKGAAYQDERRKALKEKANEADAAKLKAQCQALWGETQKQRALKGAR